MNNGQLKTKLIDWSHRSDLDDKVQSFINAATERINQRFGFRYSVMNSPTDSNQTLADHGETLYFYAAMRELSIYIKDEQEAREFDSLFEAESRRMNIHNRADKWVTDATVLTSIRSEAETAAIKEQIDGS